MVKTLITSLIRIKIKKISEYCNLYLCKNQIRLIFTILCHNPPRDLKILPKSFGVSSQTKWH